MTLLIAAVFGVAALAGCIGTGDRQLQDDAPVALLEVDEPERWVGEAFLFNASASMNANGNISLWHIDFGDGNEFETEDEEEVKNVNHTYEVGGIFNVTLTVTQDGTNETGDLTGTDAVVVIVNDRIDVGRHVNYAAPVEAGEIAKSTFGFDVAEGATGYKANLTLTSMIPAGSSSVTLRILNGQDEIIAEDEFTVDAGEEVDANLSGALESHGAFTLEILVTSGGVATEGILEIFYGEGGLERADEEDDEGEDGLLPGA